MSTAGGPSAFLVAGGIAGCLGVVLFGVAHAVVIVPIWSRLPGGIPFGVGAGLAMGWAVFELRGSHRFGPTLLSGLGVGALLWLTLLPMTAATVLFRETGFHTMEDTWEVIVELLLAVAMGGSAGWVMTHRRRGVLAVGSASLCLALAQAGPIPVTNSFRAAELWAALFVVYPLCGIALVLLVSLVTRYTGAGGGPTTG